MKKIIILQLIFTVGLLAQKQKLTLQESLDLGLKNSKELRIAQSKVTTSDAKVSEAASYLLPQLKFMAGYTRLSDIPPFEVSLPTAPNPIRISDVVLNTYQMRLSLQQPLFTGFRLSSLRNAAKLNNTASETEYIKEKNEAAFKIHSAYWQLYKAEQILELIRENLLQQKRHLDDTKNFLENGLVTQNDMLKLEVQYSNTRLQLIEAENNMDIARMAFNQALGLPLETQTEIDVHEISQEMQGYNFEEILNEAKQNRSDLKAMEYRRAASEEGITAAKAGWFPSLYLNGNVYYNRPNQRILPTQDKFIDTWDVGVTLSWDLWNWGYTSSQTTQAEQNKIQAETSLALLNDAIEIDVYQNYLIYKRANEKIEVSKLSRQQAEENYRITNEKYNVQLATSTDLIDAETVLLVAKTNYNTALVDFETAKVRLEKSLGRAIY